MADGVRLQPAEQAARAAWLISTSELRSTAITILIVGGGLLVAGQAMRAATRRA